MATRHTDFSLEFRHRTPDVKHPNFSTQKSTLDFSYSVLSPYPSAPVFGGYPFVMASNSSSITARRRGILY